MNAVNLSLQALRACTHLVPRSALLCLLAVSGLAAAQENAIESIQANQQGSNVVVKVTLKDKLAKPPIGFSVTSPARIALDFGATANATGKSAVDIGMGDVRNVNVVQAGDRSRLVFNLLKPLNYATAVDGNVVVVTIDGSGGVATPVNAAGVPVAARAASAPVARTALRDIDFRRGSNGEGRVVVDLPNKDVAVDVRQQGQSIVVDFHKTALPEVLRRRLDVTDFGTPVQNIVTTQSGENVRMVISPTGLWEHSAYQSDTQLVVEVKPIKEDPNKLVQGTQGYRGERLSLNFQNVEVRAVLQVIADFTGLNIITSDTVSGNLTLRLKDVPWDQALDIVMQAKGLDMRKNGSVLWIAPKDELLTKEKLELEQRAQIAELEPLKTETFQLNYQKAEAFKQIFGIEGGSGGSGGRSILTKRGSAVVDPRTNQLFVTDIPSKLEEIRALVQKTDIASRQVLIEARIVEADDKFSRNLGAKLAFGFRGNPDSGTFEASGQQTGTVSAAGGSGTAIGLNSRALSTVNGNAVNLPAPGINGSTPGSLALTLFNAAASKFIGLELSALEADGKGKIISSPRVVTADQLKALIEQGTELPYQQATSSGATSIAFRKANLKLEVTPQITPDGNVILDVDVSKDSVGTETRAGFAIDTKHVKTQVLIDNGGTVVIGGIFQQVERNAVTKVPLFGDIPVVGNLFKTTGVTNDKTELLIFLTPKIVDNKVALQ
ncbi:type IV pilus secretin PilQ family protein [Noviherbaspirillum aridicola]|uniref:Type IV pilus biogenesis and competence protein PilQ n=1 Tax=Noviherbaspirillum aridicola TaxID=2849687 RepID=A0ABQ4Q883_9BURK|nr:type IV pilus secretin PilQ family protein [Noviherbaspirillum aridicola]GIZ53429.1 fimbrial assembly protein PilQ [Noviherbaspirillum aridicola]